MNDVNERVLAVADAELVCQSLGIHLGRRTSNSVQMLCPYPDHQDKKFGNCQLNLHKKLFYCFACGRGGSIIDIVMLHHGWDTSDKKKSYEAMREVCSLSGADESIVPEKRSLQRTLVPPPVTEEDLKFLGLSNDTIVDKETGEVLEYSPINKMRLNDEEAYCILLLNKAKEKVSMYRERLTEELAFVVQGNSTPDTKYWLSGIDSNIRRARKIEDCFLKYLIRRNSKIGNGSKKNTGHPAKDNVP